MMILIGDIKIDDGSENENIYCCIGNNGDIDRLASKGSVNKLVGWGQV